jgi:hypothetical protein
MYPHERSLVENLADNSFALIGINSDADLEEIRGTVKEKNITWRSFWNGTDGTNGPISTRWNVTSWPTIYLLDANGVIRFKNVRDQKLDKAIESLLAELGEEVSLEELDEKSAEEKDESDDGEKADDAGKQDADNAGGQGASGDAEQTSNAVDESGEQDRGEETDPGDGAKSDDGGDSEEKKDGGGNGSSSALSD